MRVRKGGEREDIAGGAVQVSGIRRTGGSYYIFEVSRIGEKTQSEKHILIEGTGMYTIIYTYGRKDN